RRCRSHRRQARRRSEGARCACRQVAGRRSSQESEGEEGRRSPRDQQQRRWKQRRSEPRKGQGRTMSTTNEKHGSGLDPMSLEGIEAQLKQFELEERKRLGLPVEPSKHWFDEVPRQFTKDQREHTTVLVSGLTMAHDLFIQAALRGIGYKVLAMDVPDNDALQYGREYGNRGQCNPTYFTVGNLVKYLDGLRARGMSKEDIVKNHVFVTAGACGPCRFGTYVTE